MNRRLQQGLRALIDSAAAFAVAPAAIAANGDTGWLTFSILGAIVLFIVGLLWRMAMSTPTPRGFASFVARERAEGKIREWRFDEDE